MAEHGTELVKDTNAAFESIYFVASPNSGSQLGDADHMVDMVDVFTNIVTAFPDGPVTYSIEVVLAIVKLLASAGLRHLPGIAAMGTGPDDFIAKRLNAGGKKLATRYGAAASDYEPKPGGDNGFFLGTVGHTVMDRIFAVDGKANPNDLVVPRDSVFARNSHPMFPIGNTLLYRPADAVWHSGFFAQPRTINHINKHLGLGSDEAAVLRDQSVASIQKRLTDALARDAVVAELESLRGTLRDEVVVVPSRVAARPPEIELRREPSIEFHELMTEGETSDLKVSLADIAGTGGVTGFISIAMLFEQEEVQIPVTLSAPGFLIEGPASAIMTVKRERDPATEHVVFRLTARSPGATPVVRSIIATFWQHNSVIGAVTHNTTVAPKGVAAQPDGSSFVEVIRVPPRPRDDADLIITVRQEAEDTFDLQLRSRVPGEEYEEYERKGVDKLRLAGSQFSNFFKQVIDPQFATFPRDPKLADAQFLEALTAWNAKFVATLDNLGRALWSLLPQQFRDEYLRLMATPYPPISFSVL
jgi:hypothetical protein